MAELTADTLGHSPTFLLTNKMFARCVYDLLPYQPELPHTDVQHDQDSGSPTCFQVRNSGVLVQIVEVVGIVRKVFRHPEKGLLFLTVDDGTACLECWMRLQDVPHHKISLNDNHLSRLVRLVSTPELKIGTCVKVQGYVVARGLDKALRIIKYDDVSSDPNWFSRWCKEALRSWNLVLNKPLTSHRESVVPQSQIDRDEWARYERRLLTECKTVRLNRQELVDELARSCILNGVPWDAVQELITLGFIHTSMAQSNRQTHTAQPIHQSNVVQSNHLTDAAQPIHQTNTAQSNHQTDTTQSNHQTDTAQSNQQTDSAQSGVFTVTLTDQALLTALTDLSQFGKREVDLTRDLVKGGYSAPCIKHMLTHLEENSILYSYKDDRNKTVYKVL